MRSWIEFPGIFILSVLLLFLGFALIGIENKSPSKPAGNKTTPHLFPASVGSNPDRILPVEKTVLPDIDREEPEMKGATTPIIEDPLKAGRFIRRDQSGTVFFTNEGMAISLPGNSENSMWGIHWKLEGARKVHPLPGEPLTGKVHHLAGPRSGWSVNQPAYESLRYPDILPGIDLKMVARTEGVEYILNTIPGWKPEPIRIRLEGVQKIRIGNEGQTLKMETGVGTVREQGLYCYQPMLGGGHRKIQARYESVRQEKEPLSWSFALAVNGEQVDPSLPLVMDPTITWSVQVGGSWDTGLDRGGRSRWEVMDRSTPSDPPRRQPFPPPEVFRTVFRVQLMPT